MIAFKNQICLKIKLFHKFIRRLVILNFGWVSWVLKRLFRPHSLRWKNKSKHCSGWFVVREKYCSGWKNKLKSTNYKRSEQGLKSLDAILVCAINIVNYWLTSNPWSRNNYNKRPVWFPPALVTLGINVLFVYLIIRTFQLIFSARTIFFSHNKSAGIVFRLVFQRNGQSLNYQTNWLKQD